MPALQVELRDLAFPCDGCFSTIPGVTIRGQGVKLFLCDSCAKLLAQMLQDCGLGVPHDLQTDHPGP